MQHAWFLDHRAVRSVFFCYYTIVVASEFTFDAGLIPIIFVACVDEFLHDIFFLQCIPVRIQTDWIMGLMVRDRDDRIMLKKLVIVWSIGPCVLSFNSLPSPHYGI